MTIPSERISAIAADLIAEGGRRATFKATFPPLFEKHYGRAFDKRNDHDLMLAECALSEAFGWEGYDAK